MFYAKKTNMFNILYLHVILSIFFSRNPWAAIKISIMIPKINYLSINMLEM